MFCTLTLALSVVITIIIIIIIIIIERLLFISTLKMVAEGSLETLVL